MRIMPVGATCSLANGLLNPGRYLWAVVDPTWLTPSGSSWACTDVSVLVFTTERLDGTTNYALGASIPGFVCAVKVNADAPSPTSVHLSIDATALGSAYAFLVNPAAAAPPVYAYLLSLAKLSADYKFGEPGVVFDWDDAAAYYGGVPNNYCAPLIELTLSTVGDVSPTGPWPGVTGLSDGPTANFYAAVSAWLGGGITLSLNLPKSFCSTPVAMALMAGLAPAAMSLIPSLNGNRYMASMYLCTGALPTDLDTWTPSPVYGQVSLQKMSAGGSVSRALGMRGAWDSVGENAISYSAEPFERATSIDVTVSPATGSPFIFNGTATLSPTWTGGSPSVENPVTYIVFSSGGVADAIPYRWAVPAGDVPTAPARLDSVVNPTKLLHCCIGLG